LRLATNLTLYTLIGDGGVAASYNRRDASAPVVLDAGVWHHVAVVIYGPTDVEFYVDGAMVDPGSISYAGTGGIMAYANPTAPAYIGYCAVSSPVPYEGVLDEVRFYDRALSPGEIMLLPHFGYDLSLPLPLSERINGEAIIAFRENRTLGIRKVIVFEAVTPWLTRSCTYASPASLPRPSPGSLPARAGSPLTGRDSHPLDDKSKFQGDIASSSPNRPAEPGRTVPPILFLNFPTGLE
jgi:hypothetical protein